jgi:hypothetical protein
MNPYLTAVQSTAWVKGQHIVLGQPVPGRSLPAGQAWIGHDGRRARARRLRQHWARVEREARLDEAVREAREALLDAASEEPDSEVAAMQYAMMAREASDGLRTSWAASVRVLLSKRAEAVRLALEAHEQMAAAQ